MNSTFCKAVIGLFLAGTSRSADLSSSGDWVTGATASNLISGAGSDFQGQFESLAGVTTLTIFNAPGAWSLRARRGGSQWSGDVKVLVRRASGGSGIGSVSGGTGYVELTTTDAEIFSGSGARSGISLQFKLAGVSKRVSPATYLSTILFTVQ